MVAGTKEPATFTPCVWCQSHLRGRSFFITILNVMTDTKNEADNSPSRVFTFNPRNAPIGVVMIKNEPWFIAKNVCEALSISNNRDAVSGLDEDEKLMSVLPTSGQNRRVWLINESGLYNLIFQSRKPEAKAFRRWVTGEVLPAIRRTGGYRFPDAGKTMPVPVKARPTDEFYVNLSRAIGIAGSQKRLTEHLNISESIISDLFARPDHISLKMRAYIGECCRVIKETNSIPAEMPLERPRIRRSAANRLSVLVDLCRIDNSELRTRLLKKVIGGTAYEYEQA